MARSHLPPAVLMFLALSLTSDPAPAASITIKCGSDNVTVSGEECTTSDIIETTAQDDGTTKSRKVGESVHCKDDQGKGARGACTEGKASCSAAGKTSCQIAILPTTPAPPRIPGQRLGMPPAGILEGDAGGFGPQGPAPTGAPTAPPQAPPVVR